MIAIQFSNVSLVLGARAIFRGLNWEIQGSQRVGLIGPNGAGKSSLLKLICGEFTPESGGGVIRARGLSVGYLPQQPELPGGQTAFALALEGNPRLAALESEIQMVEASLSDPVVYGSEKRLTRALERQQTLLEEYQALGGEQYPARVRDLLIGLGLAQGELEKPVGVLSGGQKKLVGLARLLLAQPLPQEVEHHSDAREARGRHENGRSQAQDRQEQEGLKARTQTRAGGRIAEIHGHGRQRRGLLGTKAQPCQHHQNGREPSQSAFEGWLAAHWPPPLCFSSASISFTGTGRPRST